VRRNSIAFLTRLLLRLLCSAYAERAESPSWNEGKNKKKPIFPWETRLILRNYIAGCCG
jgi:hypothetical protein